MSALILSFKKSLEIAPKVLKDISLYFGFYFLAFCVFLIILFSFSNYDLNFKFTFLNGLFVFSKVFTVFMIPYYCYVYTYNQRVPFWNFISENVSPAILAHIKAFFIILFFLILLIIPGIYKTIRFSFLNESVFFDKERSGSALKKADQASRSYFLPLLGFLILKTFFTIFTIPSLLKFFSSFNSIFLVNLNLFIFIVIIFYLACFVNIWKTLFYFEIKEAKNQAISL
ncbi:MAG: hypothetical protein GDA46_04485 [Bdellovibrionales bacterium]|nr:hypothetical protein [Bdellovibrionales bacterium]